MEAAAGISASRGGSLRIPSPSSSRKEWRAVSDRNTGDDVDLEQSKLDQSDERTIYEHGRDPVDVDFCSITMDRSSDSDILQQRLHNVSRQREELQQMEIELRAQVIARSEIMEMQNSFDAQIKEHASAAAKLQEQLHEKDRTIRELERKVEENERELHAVKLDNEAAWAKEDLFREQSKELASFRRERDHSEAERAQCIKQIHDLQEHIQEKDRQLMELQEQNKIAQETILYKDEQLRDAQAWINHVQMDALHSTTNHSLQAELRERTEQYNQLWLGSQRQFAEMERLHLHTVQQLQLELADARERSGSYTNELCISQANPNTTSQFVQNSGNQLDANGSSATSANTVQSNGNSDNSQSFTSTGDAATQTNHVPGVAFAPSSLLGMPACLPPVQMTPLHSFVMHQQAVPHSVQPQVLQSHVGQFQSVLPVSSIQQWQQQKSQMATQNHMSPTQGDHGLVRSSMKYEYQPSVNGEAIGQDYVDVHNSEGAQPDSTISPSSGKPEALESIDGNYLVSNQSEHDLQHISSQFHDAIRLESHVSNQKPEELDSRKVNGKVEDQHLPAEQNGSGASDTMVSKGTLGNSSEGALLDERSLLACIVRTIPAGGRIRISSTLPNRLGKMLAPLHWHDYRKKHGKLDEFVASRPELFVIEGDYIQLREGAQKMVAASAAAAKVAAAASASSNYSTFLAVTPMAQSHGLKKTDKTAASNNNSHLSGPNGVSFGMGETLANIKILTKSGNTKTRPSSDSMGKQQQGRTR